MIVDVYYFSDWETFDWLEIKLLQLSQLSRLLQPFRPSRTLVYTIIIRGKVKHHGEGRHSGERYFGLLERAFTLPTRIEPDKLQAELKDGILKLEIAKHEEEKKPLQISWKEQGQE